MPGAATAGQFLRDQAIAEYALPASNLELARRLLTPLAALEVEAELDRTAHGQASYPVDLASEKFDLYVPARRPAAGYGLLVFIPPWQDARLPPGWASALDAAGMLFATPERAGNAESVLGRRAPLALLIAAHMVAHYAVDPARVYVGGFSGGSRTALRLALGYPDLFRGALLDAGSDPVGTAAVPLPARDLALRFQAFSHVVFVTGERDEENVRIAQQSVRSLSHWCAFNVDSIIEPRTGHEPVSAATLARALALLDGPTPPEPGRLDRCRSERDAELKHQLALLDAAGSTGHDSRYRRQLKSIDAKFTGVAADELRARAQAPPSPPTPP